MRRSLPFLFFLVAASCIAASPVIELPHHQTLRFIVTGDAGSTHSQLREGMLAVMKQTPIDAILLVGDNFYPCGVTGVGDPQWTKITQHFGPTKLPIYAVLGNHDYGDQQEHGGPDYVTCGHPDPQAEVNATGKMGKWKMPARNYTLHSRLVDFVMVDTQPVALSFPKGYDGSLGADGEKAWIGNALDGTHAHWRVVVGHHTIFSSGVHGRTNNATQTRVRDLLPLFRKDHVDLYICGHDHDLELLGELHRGPKSDPLFLVSGAGSGTDDIRPRRATVKEPPTIYPAFPIKQVLGFAVLEIDAMHLTVTFFDHTGKQIGGPYTTKKE
ncbi:MAG: metallophosphoesterase [Acidobacteria bacterium]|nr:metallophosphoesterase [Acidobacteriota bacterium]MBV9069241.1 metallophosphoesterase [Acidobacteriota bacterium]MBV9185112.1 metallophosphoesterase [Acidobacteriota bacterium]